MNDVASFAELGAVGLICPSLPVHKAPHFCATPVHGFPSVIWTRRPPYPSLSAPARDRCA